MTKSESQTNTACTCTPKTTCAACARDTAAEHTPRADTRPLTPKQLEVITLAHRLGFYNTPRDADLADLAHVIGISKAAIHNRLQAAERAIIRDYVAATEAGEIAYHSELLRRAQTRDAQGVA